MYKHQIKLLVLAAVIGLGAGVQIQAGDNNRRGWGDYVSTFCMGMVGIYVAQKIWYSMAYKETRLMDNFNTMLENENKDYHIIRDQNRAHTMKIFGAGYTDDNLKVLGFSNDTRKLIAFNRDQKRGDGQYTDLNATRVQIKQEKQERLEQARIARQNMSWKEWFLGK
jgi:hypothetical protein